jgi:hypothetical protein
MPTYSTEIELRRRLKKSSLDAENCQYMPGKMRTHGLLLIVEAVTVGQVSGKLYDEGDNGYDLRLLRTHTQYGDVMDF